MGSDIKLTASDGHSLDACIAQPDGAPRGAVVVIQEIFGVNDDIRATVDNFAKEGYAAVAPSLFDRLERNAVMAFDERGIDRGRSLKGQLDLGGDVIKDVNAAVEAVNDAGKVAVVGFCMGGSVAWFAAAASPIDAAVCYYGGDIPANSDKQPKCPVMFHWGAEDASIPLDKVAEVEKAHPDIPSHVYDAAGHGFSCSGRGSYHQPSARTAMERTLAFLNEHIG